jgi:prepilin-type N-terminal cleavage/methylation domain-containing protein
MNKKGFTLTELLGVLVIVGVLIIISTSVILRYINKGKKDSAYRSAVSYVTAINDYNFISEGEDLITSGNTSTITPKLKESYEGKKPDSGSVTINTTTKKVSSATLHFGSYVVTYNGSKYTISHQ